MTVPRAPSPSWERRARRAVRPVGLFLLTFLTTTATGALRQHGGADFPWWQVLFPVAAIRPISDGLSYSVPLMLILLCHELGHYFAARAHGVPASLPHFIPLPPLLGFGTMGAVIGMQRVTSDRRKLIDIGAAGPLAGLLVAIPVILYGLSLSPVGPPPPRSLQEGNSILYALLKHAVKGAWLPDGVQDVDLHPTAYAGWAGLLVTMINLMPIGQLDGGHIATAYFGNRYNRFAQRLYRGFPLLPLLAFVWTTLVVRQEMLRFGPFLPRTAVQIATLAALPWMIVWGMIALVKRASGSVFHPPVEERPLARSRRGLFWLMVVVFVALFMPLPMRETVAGASAAAAAVAPAARASTEVPH